MEQTFEYPNLVSGTDKWTNWWTPAVGKTNSCMVVCYVDFGRPLAVGDVVAFTADVEFDKLDLSGSGASLWTQGTSALGDGKYKWWYSNPLFPYRGGYFFAHRGAVFDGVERMSLRNVVSEWNGVEDGKGIRYAEFGFRCDYSGGGVAQSAASHGRAQRRGRAARMGTGRRGGVA